MENSRSAIPPSTRALKIAAEPTIYRRINASEPLGTCRFRLGITAGSRPLWEGKLV